jgi:hypothetical protein
MVGQTLTSKGTPYQYYRCRHVYDKNTSRTCSARYVRGERLEAAVWREVTRVLTDPALVLHEIERSQHAQGNVEEAARLEREVAALRAREQRLLRVYSLGTVDEELVQEELASIHSQHRVLEERLAAVRPPLRAVSSSDTALVEQACAVVADWLSRAGEEDRMFALEALQVAVVATREQATLSGVLPVDVPPFITIELTCRCLFNGR